VGIYCENGDNGKYSEIVLCITVHEKNTNFLRRPVADSRANCWTQRHRSRQDETMRWELVPVMDNMAGYSAAVRYSTRGATITHKQVIIWLISASELRPNRAGRSNRVGRLVWHNCRAPVGIGGRLAAS